MSEPTSWEQIAALFAEARERTPAERERFVRENAAAEHVRLEVLALLAADARETARFEAPEPLRLSSSKAIPLETQELHVGALLGGYRLEGVLGSGGMGTVFLAHQESLDRRVALKIVRGSLVSQSLRRRFEVEAEALARLRHPNVAQIYEAGVARHGDAEIPFFAMELIEGALPLTRFAAERGLDLRERLRLFLQACDAVQHAHERGIVHRDLKPRNVLVDSAGHVKVIDFGVARVADSRRLGSADELTAAGEIVGTLRYMAPEQLGGAPHEIDTRTDVFALGALLHELLSGEAPPLEEPTTEGLAELVQRLRERELPRLAGRVAQLEPDLDWIIARATSREPERRYASAAELGAELARALRGEPVLAGPPSRIYHLRRFVRRHRVAVGAALAVLFSLSGGLAFSWRAYLRAERALIAETAERERAEAFNGFVRDMLVSGNPLISGVRQRLEDVLEKGTRTLASGAVKDERTRAALLETIGRSYLGLGLWTEASAALEPALESARTGDGASSTRALALQLDLGWALLQRGELERAGALLETATEALSSRDDATADSVRALGSLAVLAKARGELVRAEEFY
ncbi:MAG: serine/threonine protein kinase, partial [Planctomycetes bacterium]|nr:serine/threonine protein kinase [Planctomycetota bacterium]